MYFSCKCNVSKILALVVTLKFEKKASLCMNVCMLVTRVLAGRVLSLCNPRLHSLPYECTMTFPKNIKAIEILL